MATSCEWWFNCLPLIIVMTNVKSLSMFNTQNTFVAIVFITRESPMLKSISSIALSPSPGTFESNHEMRSFWCIKTYEYTLSIYVKKVEDCDLGCYSSQLIEELPEYRGAHQKRVCSNHLRDLFVKFFFQKWKLAKGAFVIESILTLIRLFTWSLLTSKVEWTPRGNQGSTEVLNCTWIIA